MIRRLTDKILSGAAQLSYPSRRKVYFTLSTTLADHSTDHDDASDSESDDSDPRQPEVEQDVFIWELSPASRNIKPLLHNCQRLLGLIPGAP